MTDTERIVRHDLEIIIGESVRTPYDSVESRADVLLNRTVGVSPQQAFLLAKKIGAIVSLLDEIYPGDGDA